MKNTTIGFLAFVLLITASCKKKDSASGGTWSFKGTNYTASSSFVGSTGLIFYLTALNGSNTVSVNFLGSTPPASSGTFIVNGGENPGTYNNVGMSLTTSAGITYYPTGGNGSNQTVSVTVSNGKLAISGSGIEMQNSNNLADSAALQLNITQ